MFERFASPFQVVRAVESGDTARLLKLIRGGCRIGRRETYNPWKTPLDAAVGTGRHDFVKVLLDAGAPIVGSSIVEALQKDDAETLRLFYEKDPKFHQRFRQDTDHRINPRLNRWTLNFSALDYALALGAKRCADFLGSLGMKPRESSRCFAGHHAVFIEDEEPYIHGGIHIDNKWVVTKGYYCVRCERFVT